MPAFTNIARRTMLGCVTDDLSAATALLVNDSHTFDPTSTNVADVVGDEITNAGYVRQGVTFTGITVDVLSSQARNAVDDIAFGNVAAGDDVGGAYIFEDLGDDATSVLAIFIDAQATPDGGPLTVKLQDPTVVLR